MILLVFCTNLVAYNAFEQVTDELFDEIATKVLEEDELSVEGLFIYLFIFLIFISCDILY